MLLHNLMTLKYTILMPCNQTDILVLNVGCHVEFKAILSKIYIVMLVLNSIDINQLTNNILKWNALLNQNVGY